MKRYWIFLKKYGGISQSIHLNITSKILTEQYPDGLPTGKAVATSAGNMSADYVIHTVGPIYIQCGDNYTTLLGILLYQFAKNRI